MYKLLVLSAVILIVASDKVRYDNYALYKLHLQNEDQIQYLKELSHTLNELQFWKIPHNVGDYASVVASPEMRIEFERLLAERNIISEVTQENLQEAYEAQITSRRKRDASRQLYWTAYQTLDDIYSWFESLAESHGDIVTIVQAGVTHEGRNITGIRIARGSPSRAFVITGGEIGADWLSPVVSTYLVDQLVRGEDEEARAATEEFEWHIFPVVNPDGFQFSDDSVRLWLKNRRPVSVPGAAGIGVDITKNWNSQWGLREASFNPAAINFAGLGPFSEAESRSISNYINGLRFRLTGLLSFRSFGQRLLIPFAHSTNPMYNYDQMIVVGRRAMGSLAVKYGTQYVVGTSAAVSDGSTGSIADWAKHRYNPPVVATYLLRDTGTWGYILPANQVLPSCEETYDSVMAIIREAKFINLI